MILRYDPDAPTVSCKACGEDGQPTGRSTRSGEELFWKEEYRCVNEECPARKRSVGKNKQVGVAKDGTPVLGDITDAYWTWWVDCSSPNVMF